MVYLYPSTASFVVSIPAVHRHNAPKRYELLGDSTAKRLQEQKRQIRTYFHCQTIFMQLCIHTFLQMGVLLNFHKINTFRMEITNNFGIHHL